MWADRHLLVLCSAQGELTTAAELWRETCLGSAGELLDSREVNRRENPLVTHSELGSAQGLPCRAGSLNL